MRTYVCIYGLVWKKGTLLLLHRGNVYAKEKFYKKIKLKVLHAYSIWHNTYRQIKEPQAT